MKTVNTKILGHRWRINFLDRLEIEAFVLQSDVWPDDTSLLGEAALIDNIITLRGDVSPELLKQTAIHELVHAYVFAGGYHLDDPEAICDFFGCHGEKIVTQAEEIVNKFLKQKERQ